MLKRETKKQARAAAKRASVDKFSRPPRLSIEFAFIVLLRDRCRDAVIRAPVLSDVLFSSGIMGQHTDRLLEAYYHGDRALPAQLLRRTCSSGLLRHVVMQLSQFRNGSRNHEARFRIVTRVAAQHMRGARTPEVRLSFCASYFFCCFKPIAVRFRAGPSSLGRRAVPRSHRLFQSRN